MPSLPKVKLRPNGKLVTCQRYNFFVLLQRTYPLHLPSKGSDHRMRSSLTTKIDVANRLVQLLFSLESTLTEQACQ